MSEKATVLTCPCPHMIFDKDHYHECEFMPYQHEEHGPGFCCCAWFYDMAGITCHIETSFVNGKLSIVSDRNLLDVPREPIPDKNSVPKICPKGYTWETIDAKIKAFDPSFWGRQTD